MKVENYTKCPVCETPINERQYIETYVSPFNNQEYKLYECSNCEIQWWEPLKIIPEFYENEIFENYITFHEGIRSRIGENHKAFFKYFPKNVKGRLLDIGCGDGVFLKEAQKHGFEVWGIDFDKKSVEVAKKHLGVETIYPMSLEEFYRYAKDKSIKFDVITFFEVLEHQDKPKEFLEMVKDILKEGGYIAGSVPNRESWYTKKGHKFSKVDYPPHHLLRFSKEALENTLKIMGFSNVEVYKLDFPKEELPAYIEKKLFGNIDKFIDKFKEILKGFVLKDRRLANAVTVEDIAQIKQSTSAHFLKLLKNLRNFILLPFSIFYYPKLKKNGIHLYFQAKLKQFYDG